MATAGNSEILREYLVALGFKIDQTGERKVGNLLVGMDKKGTRLAKTLGEVALATVTLTTLFARSMEKMFYSARYADTTVGKLQALEFGARNVGLAGGQATRLVKGMAEAIRSNPGLVGLLKSLGVEVRGRTMDKVMLDFVRATKSMPSYVAQQYAGLFGIDPESLYNMQQGLDKMEEAAARRQQMAKDMGVDADAAAQTAREYMNMWRDVTEQAGLFAQAIGTILMPKVKELVGTTSDLMHDWVRIANEIDKHGGKSFAHDLAVGTGIASPGGGVELTDEAKKRLGMDPHYDPRLGHVPRWKRILRRIAPNGYFGVGVSNDAAAVDLADDNSMFRRRPKPAANDADVGDTSEQGWTTTDSYDPKQYLRDLEKRYGLPAGLLDRVWNRESHRGDPRYMRSPAGAMGHFGFMPDTAKEYGLKDPDDFNESARAAARKWHDLLARYHGNVREAAAAYNWGDGNLAGVGYNLGRVPDETRKYMDAVAGPSSGGDVNVNTTVNISGVQEPERAAQSVVRKQQGVASDVVRNLRPKVQ